MIKFVASLSKDISFKVAPSTTGATTRACSFGCLVRNELICDHICSSNSPGVLLNDLLHLELILAGQVEQVVHPVGGGGLEHGAPDQGAALGNHNKKVRMLCLQFMLP